MFHWGIDCCQMHLCIVAPTTARTACALPASFRSHQTSWEEHVTLTLQMQRRGTCFTGNSGGAWRLWVCGRMQNTFKERSSGPPGMIRETLCQTVWFKSVQYSFTMIDFRNCQFQEIRRRYPSEDGHYRDYMSTFDASVEYDDAMDNYMYWTHCNSYSLLKVILINPSLSWKICSLFCLPAPATDFESIE